MASILFVHTNFPAQFRGLAEALPKRGHRCAAISSRTGTETGSVALRRWTLNRGTSPGIHRLAIRAEADLMRGAAAAEAALALRSAGFSPDLVIAHPGWGESLFLRELFPSACQILYGEFYYRGSGADVGFDPEFGPVPVAEAMRVYAKNPTGAAAYAEADLIVSPTAFQASLFPAAFRDRIRIVHDGIDTAAIAPHVPVPVLLPDGTRLDPSTPLVTFVNRRFEPMRGFHGFMRALPSFLAQVPSARAVLIGADEPGGYGSPAGDGTTWKARLLQELDGRLDLSRVHFTGRLPHRQMHDVMRLGAAHIYLTYPFALSWSMIEAMALGCFVIGSRTPPVQEVIKDGENGRLVDMFDSGSLADLMAEACRAGRPAQAALRQAARRTAVARYDRQGVCEPAWLALVDEVLARGPA